MAKRGRPAGSKSKPKSEGSPAPSGHNSKSMESMNDDQMQALTRQHAAKRKELVSAEKKTKAARMNFDKIIKAELGAHGLKNIKELEELETPEGEKRFREDMERAAMVARWAGLQIGQQGSLFDEDRRPIEERAFEEGKRAGMEGHSLKPPHAPDTEAYQKYVEGWHVGQTALASFKKPATAEIVTDRKPGEPDPFDAAADKKEAEMA